MEPGLQLYFFAILLGERENKIAATRGLGIFPNKLIMNSIVETILFIIK